MPVDLRERLVAAADEPTLGPDTGAILRRAGHRRQRGRALAACGAAALTVVALLVARIAVPPDADNAEVVIAPIGQPDVIEIEEGAGAVVARLLDATADPAEVEAVLREAGLDTTVDAQPVESTRVGYWLDVETTSEHPPESGRPDPGAPKPATIDPDDPRVVEFPEPNNGSYRLLYGSPGP
jgi:hypothetical protein